MIKDGMRIHCYSPDMKMDFGLGTIIKVDKLVVEETGEILSNSFPIIKLDSGKIINGLDCWWVESG